MKFEVTLNQLREHRACTNGYNKVVSALKGIEFKEDRETYIQIEHDEPISLLSILETNGLDDALWCLRCNDKEWARDSRMFAVWGARQVQDLMIDERSIYVLDVAEKFANGVATQEELDDAWYAALGVARVSLGVALTTRATSRAAWSAAWVASRDAWSAAWDAASYAASAAAWDTVLATTWDDTLADALDSARDDARVAQKEMFIKMCNGTAPWQ